MVRPVLFLDIDDVLCLNQPYGIEDVCHTPKSEQPADLYARLWSPSAVDVLRTVAAEFDPEFVITSRWQMRLTNESFKPLFRLTGLPEVAEALHRDRPFAEQPFAWTRFAAIAHWLMCMERESHFVVLDDPVSGGCLPGTWVEDQGRLVMCEHRVGLRREHLPVIRRALSA